VAGAAVVGGEAHLGETREVAGPGVIRRAPAPEEEHDPRRPKGVGEREEGNDPDASGDEEVGRGAGLGLERLPERSVNGDLVAGDQGSEPPGARPHLLEQNLEGLPGAAAVEAEGAREKRVPPRPGADHRELAGLPGAEEPALAEEDLVRTGCNAPVLEDGRAKEGHRPFE
jgi:hypothetical protein